MAMDPFGKEFGSIVDLVTYEVTIDSVPTTYNCYPMRNGQSLTDAHWAIQRVQAFPANGDSVTITKNRWAVKTDRAGKGAYFIFKASDYQDADDFFGD